MDIHGMNLLAASEFRKRNQDLPTVPEYGPVNVTTEPGWLLRPFVQLAAALRPAPVVQHDAPCYECPPTLTHRTAR